MENLITVTWISNSSYKKMKGKTHKFKGSRIIRGLKYDTKKEIIAWVATLSQKDVEVIHNAKSLYTKLLNAYNKKGVIAMDNLFCNLTC